MNPWLYAFLTSLTVFFLLTNRHAFISNLWAGFICMAHQLSMHIIAYKLDYAHYFRVGDGMPDSIIFLDFINVFYLGIAFTMGVLFVQYLPANYTLQIIHACVWTFFFRLLYHIAELNNLIVFIHWKAWMFFYIIPVNMLALAWLKNIQTERIDYKKNVNGNIA